MLLPNRPLRNRACTPLFLLLTSHGNPSQWNTCQASHPPRGEMTVFLWLLITFPRWSIMAAARRTSPQMPLPRSSLNAHLGTLWDPTNHFSDRECQFLNTFYSSLWSLLDTKLTKSTAFYPQTDGQTEVVNWMIVHILCMYNSKNPHTWDESLPYIKHIYN
jgi:hypothetical protein